MIKDDKVWLIKLSLVIISVLVLFAPVFTLNTIHETVLINASTSEVISISYCNTTEPSFLLYEITGWLGFPQLHNSDIITHQIMVLC